MIHKLLLISFCLHLLLVSNLFHPSFSLDLYSACSNKYRCGSIGDVDFPFWGDGRPEYCGHPKLKLGCQGNNAIIEIEGIKYQVLEIEKETPIIKIARVDFLNNGICSPLYGDTTLDKDIFEYAPASEAITIFYGCNSTDNMYGGFDCNPGGKSFILPGNNTMEKIDAHFSCRSNVIVRVSDPVQTYAEFMNSTLIEEALKEGYPVSYKVEFAGCENCRKSGGVCGYDWGVNRTTCYCQGDLSPVLKDVCPSPPESGDTKLGTPPNSGSKEQTPKVVGLSIAGACILGIFIGGFAYYFIQRRKRQGAITKSKDISETPSSKSLINSSTNFSRSTPTDSYSFSKSDIEKGSTYFGTQVFSYTELEEATDNFDPSKELGEGGFGTVYYGKLGDGREVAVKRLYENNFKRVEQFMNEVEILTRLEHKNLVKLYGCTSRRSRELLLVYEFIPNGTVADHLHGKQSTSSVMSWPVRLSVAIETADALAYLHRSDIIHRDVKTNNILLDNEFRVKVADFGLSRLFPTDVTHVSTAPQGTPGYVDPEYYQCYQLTDKSDVYSFGVVLAELISSLQAVDTNRHRHDINLASMAITRIQNHAVNELIDPSLGFDKDFTVRKMTTAVAELAFRCLQQDKDMRPSMDEVVAALKAIKNEAFVIQRAEVVDIRSDDIGLLKNLPPPLSPDSVGNDKYGSNSTTPNSY
ncbi:LEAF RUST 10 DISEASE-RESISTANCE LOCUS RECEPTOR-LIKE PROTEIN KINASE-like 1.3 isoform X1 [Cannabis sativa]|uniref:LEAF RUST 10 DISEASE-RESISTANCE LOCUS RECEPTOR-LIKE PROTEIN KINASE-like 1.3 isoform X1 n=1 Tax=Cannabis sativa TaxID=3483 RepID=UPI0029CA1C48|nr:LEAF RUST 10 DISEASE-RESISTANCE LOCUS RECEPTOR-LIKE PROTEIN KINASE-like 1.3 isoform X1 [Cannabis sativa]